MKRCTLITVFSKATNLFHRESRNSFVGGGAYIPLRIVCLWTLPKAHSETTVELDQTSSAICFTGSNWFLFPFQL